VNWKIAGLVALIIVALTGFLLVLSSDEFQLVESPTIAIIVAMSVCAVVVIVVAGLWTKEWLMAFLTCGMVASLTFVLLRFGYVPAINALFDDSPGHTHRVKIRKAFPRKALFTRKLLVDSWRANPDGEVIHVPVTILDRSPTHVELTVRDGALGYEWISAIKPMR
jgi:hypothetical protein